MNILEIIAKKRDNKKLSKEEIDYFVTNYTNGTITDYQAAALIMAIYINGMDDEETVNLTNSMAYSGEVIDLSDVGNVVDKHSTGGVGDKITLILMPIIASLGIPVAKMSGRGLGFTGGTADKIETIPGYKTNISVEEFKQNVRNIGISLITQTGNLAPADKKIYALRDTISCTDNIPLIASSIMSKKIAAGANKIVLDVTCGSGAFMKTKEDAIKLAKQMKEIGINSNKEVKCVITNMDEPLGRYVGNTLEIIETVDALNGKMNDDVKEVVLELGAYVILLAGMGDNIEENKNMIMESINSKKAFEKFKELVKNQGGDVAYIENVDLFEKAKFSEDVLAEDCGYIQRIDASVVGKAVCNLGAGRISKEDKIDFSVGMEVHKKVGDYVEKGDKIFTIFANSMEKLEEAKELLKEALQISSKKVEKIPSIIDVI